MVMMSRDLVTRKPNSQVRDRDAGLAALAQAGDESAMARLIGHYTPLAYDMAASAKGDGLEDRRQIALMAMVAVVGTYDPKRGSFGTYARPWIRKALDEAAMRAASPLTIGIGHGRRSAYYNALRACEQLGFDSTKRLTDEQAAQVARLIKAKPYDVRAFLETGRGAFTNPDVLDFHADSDGPTDEALAERSQERAERDVLEAALGELTPEDRTLIERYVLGDAPEKPGRGVRSAVSQARARLVETARDIAWDRQLID